MLFGCVGDGVAGPVLDEEADVDVTEDVEVPDVAVGTALPLGIEVITAEYVGCGCHTQYLNPGSKVQVEELVSLIDGFHVAKSVKLKPQMKAAAAQSLISVEL